MKKQCTESRQGMTCIVRGPHEAHIGIRKNHDTNVCQRPTVIRWTSTEQEQE